MACSGPLQAQVGNESPKPQVWGTRRRASLHSYFFHMEVEQESGLGVNPQGELGSGTRQSHSWQGRLMLRSRRVSFISSQPGTGPPQSRGTLNLQRWQGAKGERAEEEVREFPWSAKQPCGQGAEQTEASIMFLGSAESRARGQGTGREHGGALVPLGAPPVPADLTGPPAHAPTALPQPHGACGSALTCQGGPFWLSTPSLGRHRAHVYEF